MSRLVKCTKSTNPIQINMTLTTDIKVKHTVHVSHVIMDYIPVQYEDLFGSQCDLDCVLQGHPFLTNLLPSPTCIYGSNIMKIESIL
jgi:hypothetical protein